MSLLNSILSLLYPRKCPFCRSLIEENRLLCRQCEGRLPIIPKALLPRSVSALEGCYSVFYYKDTVRESLLRYKFSGAAAYAEIYASFLAKCIDENDISCDIITWVPLSRRRRFYRGYDQAQLLAEGLSALTGIRCASLLRKIRHNPAQSGTDSAAERMRNVSGVYVSDIPTEFSGAKILLIDDIVTTGATLSECARTLKAHGAGEILALTVAAAYKE